MNLRRYGCKSTLALLDFDKKSMFDKVQLSDVKEDASSSKSVTSKNKIKIKRKT